ncbi:O-methyltransferase [Thermoflavifilum thermophilum]|uniref:Predicted O-methyltransferase YrrM n=1 Tax=Thermoflavifilum thermophilum TaxID=1393122 RepID=A0A1I7MZ25_9BACT|nr:class I SAM-dependent methyltransferase [Thermoflavifilum thermophilum]SFV27585.1 Predicted O-methyltransferase YrrM [Thermoflavifilum thermophilum]
MRLSFYWQYFQHLLHAKSRYQVHSPWVYELIEKALRHPAFDPSCIPIEKLRKQLLHDRRTIRIQDYGAGSHIHKRDIRSIQSIARHAAKPPVLARVLFQLCRMLQPAMVIELGTSLGITTAYLAKAAPQARVITVEGSESIAQEATKNFQQLRLHHIQLIQSTFEEAIPVILSQLQQPFLLFVDGDHRYDTTLNYVQAFLPYLHNDSCIVIDDIHWSRDMAKAWETLCRDQRVNLSIDLFFLGMLFHSDSRFQPEHFRLCYPSFFSWLG